MKKKIIISAVIILIPLLYSLATIQGTVRGVVTDKQGNPIEGVIITISQVQYSSVKFTVKTNKKGEYFQIGLAPDYYQIKAEKDGYLPNSVEKRVAMQVVTRVDIELEEGQYYVGGKSPGEEDYQQALQLYGEGRYEESVQALLQAIEKEPFEPIYRNNLGVVYTKIEKYDEAIEAYTKMLEIQPESYTANKMLGELYGIKQDYEKALPYYKKAVELSPDDPDAFFNLGACSMNLQDYTGAGDAFAKAIEIKSDYAAAYYQLGMVHVNQNHTDEAVRNLEKFLELAPDDPNAGVARQLVDYLKK
ncbi:MAG: tetratricopeptide repeat protein [Candidatus Aminicenantes bacterium]|nr:tetratricopeptide repeat protein [Candidatus Aminicenantes bacterium]